MPAPAYFSEKTRFEDSSSLSPSTVTSAEIGFAYQATPPVYIDQEDEALDQLTTLEKLPPQKLKRAISALKAFDVPVQTDMSSYQSEMASARLSAESFKAQHLYEPYGPRTLSTAKSVPQTSLSSSQNMAPFDLSGQSEDDRRRGRRMLSTERSSVDASQSTVAGETYSHLRLNDAGRISHQSSSSSSQSFHTSAAPSFRSMSSERGQRSNGSRTGPTASIQNTDCLKQATTLSSQFNSSSSQSAARSTTTPNCSASSVCSKARLQAAAAVAASSVVKGKGPSTAGQDEKEWKLLGPEARQFQGRQIESGGKCRRLKEETPENDYTLTTRRQISSRHAQTYFDALDQVIPAPAVESKGLTVSPHQQEPEGHIKKCSSVTPSFQDMSSSSLHANRVQQQSQPSERPLGETCVLPVPSAVIATSTTSTTMPKLSFFSSKSQDRSNSARASTDRRNSAATRGCSRSTEIHREFVRTVNRPERIDLTVTLDEHPFHTRPSTPATVREEPTTSNEPVPSMPRTWHEAARRYAAKAHLGRDDFVWGPVVIHKEQDTQTKAHKVASIEESTSRMSLEEPAIAIPAVAKKTSPAMRMAKSFVGSKAGTIRTSPMPKPAARATKASELSIDSGAIKSAQTQSASAFMPSPPVVKSPRRRGHSKMVESDHTFKAIRSPAPLKSPKTPVANSALPVPLPLPGPRGEGGKTCCPVCLAEAAARASVQLSLEDAAKVATGNRSPGHVDIERNADQTGRAGDEGRETSHSAVLSHEARLRDRKERRARRSARQMAASASTWAAAAPPLPLPTTPVATGGHRQEDRVDVRSGDTVSGRL